ncbi:MAG: efflux RND transporter periplasmic adaptor subunit [Pseudomonadota bacterium]
MKEPLLKYLKPVQGKLAKTGPVVLVLVAVVGAFAMGYLIRGGPKTGGDGHGLTAVHDGDRAEVWTCSMHPQIRRPGPGQCPICGMDLIPVVQDKGGDIGERQIRLSDHARLLAEVRALPVERASLTSEVKLVGKVDFDETAVGHITAWVPGRIDKLFVNFTGIHVKRGQAMVSLYSPKLLLAQEELIQASKMAAGLSSFGVGGTGSSALEQTLEASRERLRLWGLSGKQVTAIEKSGKHRKYLTITAPMGGVVIHKNAFVGMYVEEGTKIFTIADLSRLWVMLDAYESDLSWIRVGQEVDLEVEAYPGEEFKGKVSFIDPVINPSTRTARVRVEVPNDEGLLKPEMFVHAAIQSSIDLATTGSEPPLVIPASAPLITGKRAVVYVEVEGKNGVYEGREVVLGPKAGDHYIVLEGLKEGERVVVRGNFKIDSAMQILAKPSMMSPQGGAAPPAHHHGGPPASATAPPPRAFKAPPAFLDQLATALDSYLEMHAALAADDAKGAKQASRELKKALDAADMKLLEGDAHVEWMKALESVGKPLQMISGADGLDAIRTSFAPLSEGIITMARAFGSTGGRMLYLKHCPMALDNKGANWLQPDPVTRNPYFGSKMLTCAEDVETLGKPPGGGVDD